MEISKDAAPETLTAPTSRKTVRFIESIKTSAFVIGSALVIFAAARNTITWYLEHLWGFSGHFWESRWQFIDNLFGQDDFLIASLGTCIVTTLAFWLFNAPFLYLDVTGNPGILLAYKIQQAKQVPVDWQKFVKALKRVTFNQLVLASVFTLVMTKPFLMRGCGFRADQLPSFHWVLLEICVFSLVEEVLFYYGHRLLHHPRLYKHVHKIHHEWTAPISIVSIYAHPIEHILCNIFPPFAGPLLMGSHVATTWLWFIMVIGSTTVSHCGYHLPFLFSPEAHDFHHLKFVNCFGVLGILDRLHGTDEMFRKTKSYDRHIMSLNLMPVNEQFPDSPGKKGE